MKTMSIYEPAMCCETGICGVSVDPELLRISAVFNALNKNGVVVSRFNLNSAPMAFINNQTINKLINEDGGMEKLPTTLINDEVVLTGRYPTNEEIVKFLEVPESYVTVSESAEGEACCCGDDTSCCDENSDCCADGKCC